MIEILYILNLHINLYFSDKIYYILIKLLEVYFISSLTDAQSVNADCSTCSPPRWLLIVVEYIFFLFITFIYFVLFQNAFL